MESEVVTIKVSKNAHEELRRLRHVFFVDTYPEVVDRLIQEYVKSHPLEASA
ncbi:hypothetical protein ACNF40_06610 [Cuniculiplasma sp. SKW4]|uniref:hypothetical protein n=1 Tax=Cuniculiplasma sp. SKW4 TaxID=3400171 RepID=UPI003FD2435C